MNKPALLALEDGTVFYGESIGSDGETIGEVVFNTAMTGYQEILTDPSYAKQLVTLTYPHIGNVGTNSEDEESRQVFAGGLIIRDLPPTASNWRSQEPLDAYLKRNGVVAIADIDTRKLTRILREKGSQNGCIMAGKIDEAAALKKARAFPGLKGMDLAKEVTVNTPYDWVEGGRPKRRPKTYSPCNRTGYFYPMALVTRNPAITRLMRFVKSVKAVYPGSVSAWVTSYCHWPAARRPLK